MSNEPRIFTLVKTASTGKVHIIDRIPGTAAITPCGQSFTVTARDAKTLTGSEVTCRICRRRTPAGQTTSAEPTAAELRAQYKRSLLLQLAELLTKNVAVSDGSGFDLTAEQAASVRAELAKVLDNRARTGRMSK